MSRRSVPTILTVSAGALLAAGLGLSAEASAAPAPHFHSCKQAEAAGFSNIPKGAPGYRKGLDGDHDGVACEVGDPMAAKSAATPAPASSSATSPMSSPSATSSNGPRIQTDLVASHGSNNAPLAFGAAGLTALAGAGIVVARRRTN